MEVQTVYLIMGYFLGFEKFGIDVFYNRKYQKWLFDNSTDADKNIHPIYDINGFIINAKFSAFHNSIPLTENDFISIQIKRLNTFIELKDLKNMDLIQIKYFKRYLENKAYPQHISGVSEKSQFTYNPKPNFRPESIENIITTLNPFFDASQHAELKRIIETGSNSNGKLLFRDNGNKLTDCFRELYDNNTITGCTKTVLINWIIDNFKFTFRKVIKDYDFKTAEKIISNTERLCKNPII